MDARIVIIGVVPALTVRCLRPVGIHEPGKLRVSNFSAINEELRHFNLMPRLLIRGAIVISHPKRAGGDAHHVRRLTRMQNSGD